MWKMKIWNRRNREVAAFDIQHYLTQRRLLVDRALERYLKEYTQHPKILYEAMHYGLFSGGKRIRPILTLASGELFGASHRSLLPFACGLELIHTYSIIHDDLPALDNDEYRRGEPASHKVFGEGIALLAGDALLTEAFHLMSRPRVLRALEPRLVLEVIHEISHAAGVSGLVGGQVIDLESEGHEADLPTVEYMHVRKTGALILAAARIGARIGGATAKELRRITRYAEFLGLAFQIVDDILDTATAGRQGCSQASEKEKKKTTYPSTVGVAAARSRVRELLQDCLKEIEPFGRGTGPLQGIATYVIERAF
jgi:geranylgeranyl diphosphate synthase type II